eukprot:5525777-Pyramimonas_sp.AAC.1
MEPPDYDRINAQVDDYTAQRTDVHGDISSVVGHQRTDAQNLLDSIYEDWVSKAWAELQQVTQTSP